MKAQRTATDPWSPASKKPRTTAEATPTASDARTRLRTQCALQIERAHEPGDIQRVMEDLTPAVLREWPDLLPLLARRVVTVCRNDLAVLQQAIEFCLPADLWKVVELDAVEPHPWGDQAEAVLLLWIEQAEGIPLPSAQAVLAHVARHLERARQQAGRDFTEANKACAEALRTLTEREAGLEGLPGETLLHVVRCLVPEFFQPKLALNGEVVSDAVWICGSVALVNHACHQQLKKLLEALSTVQNEWADRLAAELQYVVQDFGQSGYREFQSQEVALRIRDRLRPQGSLGRAMWSRVIAQLPLALSQETLGQSVLAALFMQADREQAVQWVMAMLDVVMRLLDENDPCERQLQTWPRRMLAQVYRKYLSPDDEAFKRLIDAVLARAHHCPSTERAALLLELAALSLTDAPRLQAAVDMLDGLRRAQEPIDAATFNWEPIDWALIGDCLHVLRGCAQGLSDSRVRAVLDCLLDQPQSVRGAAYVLGLSAIARLPRQASNEDLLFEGIGGLMTQATATGDGEPAPPLYAALFKLFSGTDLLNALARRPEASLPALQRKLLYPATWDKLPLWRALVVQTPFPEHARAAVSKALAQTSDAGLRSELQALLDQLAQPKLSQ